MSVQIDDPQVRIGYILVYVQTTCRLESTATAFCSLECPIGHLLKHRLSLLIQVLDLE